MAKRKKKNKKKLLLFLIPILIIIFLLIAVIVRPLYEANATITLKPLNNPGPNIVLPKGVESAVTIQGSNEIISSNSKSALPTASTAKIITALVVLKKYPLQLGQQGPLITLGPNDVALYNSYLAQGASVTAVNNGEQISEYEALQLMLLPSSCNMSDSLAIWAFGSLATYQSYAMQYLQSAQINQTNIGTDASGFSPSTLSTPEDLIKIGNLALNNSVIAQIINQKTAIVPVQGLIHNVNFLLGTNGIVGIKTGNNNQDPGVYLFAAKNSNPSTNIQTTTIGAIMGGSGLYSAMSSAVPLINSSLASYRIINYPSKDKVIGYYTVPWSKEKFNIVASENVQNILWAKTTINPHISVSSINYKTKKDSIVGTLTVNKTSQNLILNEKIPAPSLVWEIEHLF